MPRLVVFHGLPGTGKTTLSRRLAREMGATYLRVDAMEPGLRASLGIEDLRDASYRAAVGLARDALALRQDVVVDAVHGMELLHAPWKALAIEAACELIWVLVTCADAAAHRARIEARGADWGAVQRRRFASVEAPQITLDTSAGSPAASLSELRAKLVAI